MQNRAFIFENMLAWGQFPLRLCLGITPVLFDPPASANSSRRSSKAHITCKLPLAPLAEREYFLIHSESGQRVFDYVVSALRFIMIDCDPWGAGYGFRQRTRQGRVHLDAIFDLGRQPLSRLIEPQDCKPSSKDPRSDAKGARPQQMHKGRECS